MGRQVSFKQAVLLVAIFAIFGAMLQGHHVMHTIGKGIVKTDLNYLAVCVALICSGFFVTLATFFRIPTFMGCKFQNLFNTLLNCRLDESAGVDQ